MGKYGLSELRDAFDAPRKHPVGVLVTDIPLFIFWIFFAVRDIADGSIKMKGDGAVILGLNPLKFYFSAAIIIAVAIFIAIRIMQACFALADARNA